MNVKNVKTVLSGPLHKNMKPIGSSHMEHRDKKMKDMYKNAKPKSKGVSGLAGFNNQAAVLQYSQNNFIQNKPQFSTFYGQGNMGGPSGNCSIGATSNSSSVNGGAYG